MSVKNHIRRFNFRLIGSVGLAVVFVITVGLVMSLVVRVVRGVSHTAETPEHVLRLEVLNDCRGAGLAAEAARILSDYRDNQLEIIVVSTGDFDSRKILKTFVVSREKDRTAARHLARLIGLDDSAVLYRPLVNNYRQVSATLVLGEDYVATMLPATSDKE